MLIILKRKFSKSNDTVYSVYFLFQVMISILSHRSNSVNKLSDTLIFYCHFQQNISGTKIPRKSNIILCLKTMQFLN